MQAEVWTRLCVFEDREVGYIHVRIYVHLEQRCVCAFITYDDHG